MRKYQCKECDGKVCEATLKDEDKRGVSDLFCCEGLAIDVWHPVEEPTKPRLSDVSVSPVGSVGRITMGAWQFP